MSKIKYHLNDDRYLRIPVIREWDAEYDLSRLDYSSLEVKLVRLESHELEDEIEKLACIHEGKSSLHLQMTWFESLRRDYHNSMAYVIMPQFHIPKKDSYLEDNYRMLSAFYVIQIIQPSKLHLWSIIDFNVEAVDEINHAGSMTTYPSKYLGLPDRVIEIKNKPAANSIINLFAANQWKKPFITSLTPFVVSFHMGFESMHFLNLMMSLEALIVEGKELSYRLCRGVAILTGRNSKDSEVIFANMKKLYSLRSKITHGAEYSDKSVNEYLSYLVDLVSIYLVALLDGGFDSVKELNNALTSTGFGDKGKLSDKFSNPIVNDNIYNHIQETSLSK